MLEREFEDASETQRESLEAGIYSRCFKCILMAQTLTICCRCTWGGFGVSLAHRCSTGSSDSSWYRPARLAQACPAGRTRAADTTGGPSNTRLGARI